VPRPMGRSQRPDHRACLDSGPRISSALAWRSFLGIDQGQVAGYLARRPAAGFGYKCILQPEELCVAWLALKIQEAVSAMSKIAASTWWSAPNSRQHHYRVTAYADERGRLLALDAEGHDRRRRVLGLAVHRGVGAGVRRRATCRDPTTSAAIACRTCCVATNKPRLSALSRRGPNRRLLRHGVGDRRDRACGRPASHGRCVYDNLVSSADMPYDNVARKHYDSGDYRKALTLCARKSSASKRGASGNAAAERDGRLIGIGFRLVLRADRTRHQRLFPDGACRSFPVTTRRRWRVNPDGGARSPAPASTRMGRAWRRRSPRSRMRSPASISPNIWVVLGDTGTNAVLHRPRMPRASIVMAGRRGLLMHARRFIPRFLAIGAHLMAGLPSRR